MGKMKELYVAIQEGYIEDLRKAYLVAYQNNQDTVLWQGKEVSLTYAKYLLEFEYTFHESLRSMAPSDDQADNK